MDLNSGGDRAMISSLTHPLGAILYDHTATRRSDYQSRTRTDPNQNLTSTELARDRSSTTLVVKSHRNLPR